MNRVLRDRWQFFAITRTNVIPWILSVLIFSTCVCAFPILECRQRSTISYRINSELFASSPAKRRRKRDILRSWTVDLFRSEKVTRSSPSATTNTFHPTNQTTRIMQLPVSRLSLQEENPILSGKQAESSFRLDGPFETNIAQQLNTVQPATRALLAEVRHAISSNDGMVSLPPKRGTLTPLEKEFRTMLSHFTTYTHADMLGIEDPTKRILFQGIAASADCPAVYRAFEVLYEDLLPLRVAGRVVFKLLRNFMAKSVGKHRDEIVALSDLVSASPNGTRQLEELRLLFIMAASKLNGGGQLTTQQLLRNGVFNRTAHDVLGFASPSELVDLLEQTDDGKVTFVNLVTGLWKCAEDICGLEQCDPQQVLYDMLVEINDQLAGSITVAASADEENPSKIKYGNRYDAMVDSFVEWKDRLPASDENNSRRMQVVRGCFVGAEIPQVVAALRIVYVEFTGLRLAGDIIFALVSKLMNKR